MQGEQIRLDVRDLGFMCKTKWEVYNSLTVKGDLFLLSLQDTNCDYIWDILAGGNKKGVYTNDFIFTKKEII